MAFAILRTAKLKTAGNIGGLNAHLTRSKEVANADQELRIYNSRPIGSTDLWTDVQNRLQEAGVTKVRKDAVLAVEHLITASPEHFNFHKKVNEQGQAQIWGRADRWIAFEKASIEWLQERYGKENLVNVTVHHDEQSPHIHAIVVPVLNGKLNCKAYLGGREKLRDMQSSFADKVKDQGLERGIEGSKAHHTQVKEFYGHIKQVQPPSWDLQLDKAEVLVKAPEKTFIGIGYTVAPEEAARQETARINQHLTLVHKQNQEKAHKRLLELHQAAQGASVVKRKNEELQRTLGALNKENEQLKGKLKAAGMLLEHVANGNVYDYELRKALEQVPKKDSEREKSIWAIMKETGLQVKEEPKQEKQMKRGRGLGL